VFIAEIAAILNEQLVYRDLANRRSGITAQRAILDYRARAIVLAFYRQAILADFECRAHSLVEHQLLVDAPVLEKLYVSVLHDYYGDAFAPDEFVSCEWAGVPHLFTSPFYVYQYATSFAISSEICSRISSGAGGWNLAAYLAMLKSGGAGTPRDLMEECGIVWDGPSSSREVAGELAGIVAKLESMSQE
jgi:oligoendopeptidase F